MKFTRPRFTIGYLMIAVLLFGATLAIVENRRRYRAHRARLAAYGAAYQQAVRARQAAESALINWERVEFPVEKQTVEKELEQAKAARKAAEERVKRPAGLRRRGMELPRQSIADQVALQQKVFAYEQAQTKLKVLLEYTGQKVPKELASTILQARETEVAKKKDLDAEVAAGSKSLFDGW